MIDVNLITDLLIQHSQSTGFEKSLEMLTQTLQQLTDSNPIPSLTSTTTTSSAHSSSHLPQSNPFGNLLMKNLQPPIPPTVLPPPTTSHVWFNSTTPQTFQSSVSPFLPPSGQQAPNAPMNFHSLQQYQNHRN